MSKRINVNPDHYKVAGRERPGDAEVKGKTPPLQDVKAQERWDKRQDQQQPAGGGESESEK